MDTINNRPLSRNAETKDFARLTSHPVRGQTCKNKAFCSPGTQNGRFVIKVYCRHPPGTLRPNRAIEAHASGVSKTKEVVSH